MKSSGVRLAQLLAAVGATGPAPSPSNRKGTRCWLRSVPWLASRPWGDGNGALGATSIKIAGKVSGKVTGGMKNAGGLRFSGQAGALPHPPPTALGSRAPLLAEPLPCRVRADAAGSRVEPKPSRL